MMAQSALNVLKQAARIKQDTPSLKPAAPYDYTAAPPVDDAEEQIGSILSC